MPRQNQIRNPTKRKRAIRKIRLIKRRRKENFTFYHKEGHYIKDCFEKKKLKKLQKESNGKIVITSEDERDFEGVDILIAAEKQPTGEWILDFGKPHDLSNLRIFGYLAYAHINQGKLNPKAIKGYFIRYPKGVKEYKIWYIDGKPSRTLISKDVVFYKELVL